MDIKILVAEQVPLMRMGLRMLLEASPGVTVVGEAWDAAETLRLVRELEPDLLMLGLCLPDLEALALIPQVLLQRAETRIVVMSDKADRNQAADALKAGAAGYLLKSCAGEEVAMAARSVMAGNVYLSPYVADMIVNHYVLRHAESAASLQRSLSARERKVLQLLADGMTSKEIAEALVVSVKTIDTHRQQIMSKLGIRSIARLTKYAVREGLSPLEVAE